jgi:hypothetical protein
MMKKLGEKVQPVSQHAGGAERAKLLSVSLSAQWLIFAARG